MDFETPRSGAAAACRIKLSGEVDAAGFRSAARCLIANGVAPEQVHWHVDGERAAHDLFDEALRRPEDLPMAPAALRVPRSYSDLCDWALLHCDPQRFARLYRLLWRLQHESGLRSDPLDAQWAEVQLMAHAVRRDFHKMKAFVRFRVVERVGSVPPLHVAWFEPEHHVVERAAPFFAGRFATIHWVIQTPLRSVHWDGANLRFGPGADRSAAPPADAGEALWLTYYQQTFNPARLKLAMMEREMPRRYWQNLPEAVLIHALSSAAHQRSMSMIDDAPTTPARKLGPRPRPAGRRPAMVFAESSPTPASAEARETTWAATREANAACQQCPLHAGATQAVFGEGPVGARLMFVGEQPGDQEDLHGRPFVGPAGQLFERALAELGLARGSVYITNAVKHFKYELRGQRRIHKTPAQQEVAACLDWLERELTLVKPEGVVALGATAARALVKRPVAVTRERGQWLLRDDGVPVFVTLHPSALLRMPPDERDAAYRQWLADLALAVRPRV